MSQGQKEGNGGCFLLVISMLMMAILGYIAGTLNHTLSVDGDTGFPVSQVQLESSGDAINFTLASVPFRVQLVKAYDRPPNLDAASRVYVYSDRLVFAADGARLMEVAYHPPLQPLAE